MGALEDYYNQLEASAQAAKAKMWNSIEQGYSGMEDYLQAAKADAFGYAPTEEQMRLKRLAQEEQAKRQAENDVLLTAPDPIGAAQSR